MASEQHKKKQWKKSEFFSKEIYKKWKSLLATELQPLNNLQYSIFQMVSKSTAIGLFELFFCFHSLFLFYAVFFLEKSVLKGIDFTA